MSILLGSERRTAFARRARRCASLATPIVLLLATSLQAAPSGFRGDGTGRYPDAKPPLRWGATKNVVWATPLPAWGNATPVLAGECVIVTFEPTGIACVARKDGKLRWRRELSYADTVPPSEQARVQAERKEAEAVAEELRVARGDLDELRRAARRGKGDPTARERVDALVKRVEELRARHDRYARHRPPDSVELMGNASSTPVTDGRSVFAVFGNSVVASVGLDGTLRWARHLPYEELGMHGYGKGQAASPLLAGETLIVPLGKLHGLDPATGATRWSTEQPYRDYGTPFVARVGQDDVIFTPSGAAVRAKDGKTIAAKLDFVLYVGPIVHDGVLYFAGNVDSNPPNPAVATALRLPAALGDPFTPARAWRTDLANKRQYATPLVHGGHVFLVSAEGDLTVLEAKSGRTVEARRLEIGRVFASPTLAGSRVYVTDEDGGTSVIDASPPFALVARNTLEPTRASPVFDGRRLYVRTLEKLYCFEER